MRLIWRLEFLKFRHHAMVYGGSATGDHSSMTPGEDNTPPSGSVTTKDNANKFLWVNVVKNMPSLSKHDFQISVVDCSKTVVVPDEVLSDTPLWKDFLIGTFLSAAPHIAKINVIKIWHLGDKTAKIDVFQVND